MERLVTTLGGPLCSTLMIADNLEVIAHACRAMSKLSDANTTVQVRGLTEGNFEGCHHLCNDLGFLFLHLNQSRH